MITVINNIVIAALLTICVAIVLRQVLALTGVLIYLQPGNSTCEVV